LKDFISKNSKKEIENEILEIYKPYNPEAFDNISKNILFIDKMIITMRTKKPRQSKQIYDNIMFISKECNNDFHSFIYSIPPDEIELNERFKDDLRFFKSITNEKIRIARNIYVEKNKDIINSFSDLVNESDSGSTPMPYISEYQEKYNFY